MIIWSSDLIELVCVFKAFASRNFQVVLVERLKITHVMQIHIPLKRALTKMWWVWFKSGLKIPTKIQWVSQKCVKLGLLSLQFDSISVYIGLSQNGRQRPIFIGKCGKICVITRPMMCLRLLLHVCMRRGACDHALGA